MGNFFYNGKEYTEPSLETQKAFHEVNIHTFRYYPQECLMVASDYFMDFFKCPKFIPGMPQSLAEGLIHKDDWEVLFKMHSDLIDGKKKTSAILRTKDGISSRVTITAVEWDEDNRPTIALGVVEDVAEDLRSERIIKALSDDYESVYYVDFDENAIYPFRFNPYIETKYGDFFKSKPTYESAIQAYINNTVEPGDREEMLRESTYENLVEQLKGKKVFMHDYRANHDGDVHYCRMKVVNLMEGEELHNAVIGFADVSREKAKELERYAYIDNITGGDNYIRFKEKLREDRLPGYLASMDVHDFKIVNSVCGSAKGDEVLYGIWKCIESRLGENDRAAHINADHFVIFFATDKDDKVSRELNIISNLLSKLADDMQVPQLIPYFGASMWDTQRKIEETYSEANTAKHEIKHRKDSNLAFYSSASAEKLILIKQLEDSFDKAIQTGAFEVWYQPKYNPYDESVVGAEALIRWRKDDGSLLSPGIFIPIFEKNGLIRILDEYVFKKVCEQQIEWKNKGIGVIPISVNLSRASLYYQNVVEHYKNIACETGVEPEIVPIEITESAAVANSDIKSLADTFYEAGFPLHMDDFGTGYSSMATLNIMHIDTLKIDKTLVDYIGNYRGDRLLEHTVALAKELGMHVTAEGVENKEQVEFLQKLNCDSIQGFYYSKPLPLEEFEKIIA